jgi:hypothetical protein
VRFSVVPFRPPVMNWSILMWSVPSGVVEVWMCWVMEAEEMALRVSQPTPWRAKMGSVLSE